MEKFIYEYLDQHYHLSRSQVGNDGIYRQETLVSVAPTKGDELIKELQDIFSLDENEIFIIINDWCLINKPTADMFFYWKSNSEIAHSSFQKNYLGGFDPNTKLVMAGHKLSLLQRYVQNYQYR